MPAGTRYLVYQVCIPQQRPSNFSGQAVNSIFTDSCALSQEDLAFYEYVFYLVSSGWFQSDAGFLTISYHLFQPQVTSNSCNIWCIGRLHLMGLRLLSHWWAETFHEGSNESLGAQTFVQTSISVSVAIVTCICVLSITDCMSPQSGSNHSGEFICILVLSRPSPCTKIVISEVFLCSGMRGAEHTGDI